MVSSPSTTAASQAGRCRRARRRAERCFVNLYFACSLTGGRGDEGIYAHIVDHLLATGHEVPTAHLARPEVMELERVVIPADVYRRDIGWIEGCQAMIAEVSTPSHGVGYEIAYALGRGKPVLCCFREGRPVSKMLTGNSSDGLQVLAYRDEKHAIELVDAFLREIANRSSRDEPVGEQFRQGSTRSDLDAQSLEG